MTLDHKLKMMNDLQKVQAALDLLKTVAHFEKQQLCPWDLHSSNVMIDDETGTAIIIDYETDVARNYQAKALRMRFKIDELLVDLLPRAYLKSVKLL